MVNSTADDERAIRELVETWFEATRAGDLEAVLNLMTDDIVFLVPDEEPFGKAAFEAASTARDSSRIDVTGEIEELQIFGDWAYIRNWIEMTETPSGGDSVRRSGYTLSILRKATDGTWRLARDANLVTDDE